MIVHVAESFGGGVYDFIKTLVKGLPQFRHAVIYGPRGERPGDFKKEFPPETLFIPWSKAGRSIHPLKDAAATYELYQILSSLKGEVEVLHLHSSKAGFIGRLVARWLRLEKKVIYTPHGPAFLRQDVSPAKRRFFLYLERIAYRFGGKVVACSPSEAEALREAGIPASFITTGIECKSKPLVSGPGESSFTVITVGRITYQKNPSLFNEIARQLKEVNFIWVGDGELRDELTSPNVTVTGWLESAQVHSLLKKAHLYLSTSLWEGLPLSVLHAMCAGKPLLLTPCVGNRDTVSPGYNGFFFRDTREGAGLIRFFKEHPSLLASMGENSYKLLSINFSLKGMLNGYADLYERVGSS